MNDLPALPPSSDEKFWDDAEKHQSLNRPVSICPTHTKDSYMEHRGYIDNHNGTISCKFCVWGTALPGFIKLIEDRLVDLRSLPASQQ